MFLALVERMRKEHERQFVGFACLRSDITNASQFIDHRKRQFKPEDFMPGAKRVTRMSGKQFFEMVTSGKILG